MEVTYIDHMGDDLSVVDAARVSFSKESQYDEEIFGNLDKAIEFADKVKGKVTGVAKGVYMVTFVSDKDKKLIEYLAKHAHWTPFAHTAVTLRMKAPIPIRTQCFKHKVGLVENEESRRYISTAPTFHMPDYFRCKPEGSAKQGSKDTVHEHNTLWMDVYESHLEDSIKLYDEMIEDGVAPEQARFVLPQGVEVSWIWTGNLQAFARFYMQRVDSHAQKEIQELALKVGDIMSNLFPVAWKALTNGQDPSN